MNLNEKLKMFRIEQIFIGIFFKNSHNAQTEHVAKLLVRILGMPLQYKHAMYFL